MLSKKLIVALFVASACGGPVPDREGLEGAWVGRLSDSVECHGAGPEILPSLSNVAVWTITETEPNRFRVELDGAGCQPVTAERLAAAESAVFTGSATCGQSSAVTSRVTGGRFHTVAEGLNAEIHTTAFQVDAGWCDGVSTGVMGRAAEP